MARPLPALAIISAHPMEHPGPIPRSLYVAMTLQHVVGGSFLPFVSLYLKDRGLSDSDLGWVYLAASLVAVTVPIFWGIVADRWVHANRLYVMLHLGGALVLLMFARQTTLPALLAALTAFFAFYQPTNALLSALSYHNLHVPEAQFARLRLWGSVGWIAPSIPIALWLALSRTVSLSFIPYLAAALEVLLALLALSLPRTPPRGRAGSAGEDVLPYGPALRELWRRPGFTLLLGVAFLVHASFAILFYYSPPYLEEAGIARPWIGPIQSFGVVVEVPLFFLLPFAIRRLGYHGTVAVGCVALLVRQVLYSVSTDPVLLAGSYVLAGVCVVFYLTGLSLAVNAMAGRAVRATAQTVLTLAGPGLGQMSGHAAVGWLASYPALGLAAGFLFAAASTAAAIALLALARWRSVRKRMPGD
jgi:hypothetical protein